MSKDISRDINLLDTTGRTAPFSATAPSLLALPSQLEDLLLPLEATMLVKAEEASSAPYSSLHLLDQQPVGTAGLQLQSGPCDSIRLSGNNAPEPESPVAEHAVSLMASAGGVEGAAMTPSMLMAGRQAWQQLDDCTADEIEDSGEQEQPSARSVFKCSGTDRGFVVLDVTQHLLYKAVNFCCLRRSTTAEQGSQLLLFMMFNICFTRQSTFAVHGCRIQLHKAVKFCCTRQSNSAVHGSQLFLVEPALIYCMHG
jgi:hypothetical protein